MTAQIILASASPRRQELLQQIGVKFQQRVAEIDETPGDNESARDYVTRLALEKARAVRRRSGDEQCPVLGADTEVVLDGRPMGKPGDLAHAREMLGSLSGRSHQVLSPGKVRVTHQANIPITPWLLGNPFYYIIAILLLFYIKKVPLPL